MRKAVFLSFLWLANVALLAHAVIPHHHHSSAPAAVCMAHHIEHSGATHAGDDADENGDWADCMLSFFYAKTDPSQTVTPSPDTPFQPVVCLLFLCPDCAITQITALAGLPFRLKPYIPFASTEFIARSIGLRAPPVC
ncbi:MAG: hypothetical protein LBB64_03495 [Dysgonamonadaceae bacterium]|jgi:hypothetical protein|nr:hypothetical protein [Dysgonamonadaceae bacterium]